MKKVLFATTALVLSAGFAAAEVSLSGDGRMGVVYDGNDWNFDSRARVKFTLSGTTDGGLEFGGAFRVDQEDELGSRASNGTAGSVFISGAFGKIEMGDVVSAPEALFGDLPEVGYTDLETAAGLSNDIPYLTLDNGTQSALLYTYTTGALSLAASLSDGVGEQVVLTTDDVVDTQQYAVAAAYGFGNYTVGLGYEVFDVDTVGEATQTELAGIAKFGNTTVTGYYAIGGDQNPVDNAIGLGVSSVFGATTVNGYVQKAEFVGGGDVTWYGLGAAYDLGGGASVVGGIADDDLDGSEMVADLGVKFKF